MAKCMVIGMGEIGTAVAEALRSNQELEVLTYDHKDPKPEWQDVEYLHICIPYSENFVAEVTMYQYLCNAHLTLIHSTVPVGTTLQVFNVSKRMVVHTPVRGKHPRLRESLSVFVKFIGPCNVESGRLAKEHLESVHITCILAGDPQTTEAAKVLDTTYYGTCIAYHQEAERFCRDVGADFNIAMTKFNETYNEGYKEMGMEHVVRPVLTAGWIGGHCVTQNAELLLHQYPESIFAKAILDSNELKKNEISQTAENEV